MCFLTFNTRPTVYEGVLSQNPQVRGVLGLTSTGPHAHVCRFVRMLINLRSPLWCGVVYRPRIVLSLTRSMRGYGFVQCSVLVVDRAARTGRIVVTSSPSRIPKNTLSRYVHVLRPLRTVTVYEQLVQPKVPQCDSIASLRQASHTRVHIQTTPSHIFFLRD